MQNKIKTFAQALAISLALLISLTGHAQITSSKASIKLGIKHFKTLTGYKKENNKQPISSAQEADEFIFKLLDGNRDVPVNIQRWYLEYFPVKKSAIILLQHPLDLARLEGYNSAQLATISSKASDFCTQLEDASDAIEIIDNQIAAQISPGPLVAEKLSAMMTSKTLLKALQISLKDSLKTLESEFQNSQNRFVELSKTEQFVIHKEKGDYSPYLYNLDEVLFVIVGGANDISNSKFTVDNKPSAFEVSLNEFKDFATTSGLAPMLKAAGDNCGKYNIKDTTIVVNLVLLNSSKIKLPATIEVSNDPSKDKLQFDLHEKSFASIKIGIAGNLVDRKNFNIDADNNLVVTLDEAKKTELKGNLFAMFEYYPAGRDIDRFDPVWKKSNPIGALNPQRFGLCGGLKLSKDPLESIFAGVAYGLTKECSLNFGFNFVSTPKDQITAVDANATLDYLQKSVSREYVPKFFFGISLAPLAMGKTLGIGK